MIAHHLSFQTLSRNIRLYSRKSDKSFLTNFKKSSNVPGSTLSDLNLRLGDKVESIERLIGFLEDVTWLDIPDEQTRDAVLELVHIAKHYLQKQQSFAATLQLGRDIKDFDSFQVAVQDLAETIQDVESAIITLPQLDGFKEIFDELSGLK